MEETNVGYSVLHHDETLDASSECKALILLRIDAHIPQHLRVHHASTHNLDPPSLFARNLKPRINLDRGLGEGEEGGAETHLRILAEVLFRLASETPSATTNPSF